MLRTRVITALVLVAGLGVVFFALPAPAPSVLFGLIAALAGWEWAGLMRQDGPARVMYAAVLVLFCWQIAVGAAGVVPLLLGLSAAFWLVAAPLWLRHKWTLAGNDAFGYAMGALIILPTWAAMEVLYAAHVWVLLAAMALVWVADIAAYFTGRAFGRHKLAPAISPGKTWEGVAGAVVGVMAYGFVLLTATPLAGRVPLPLPLLAGLLVLLTAISVMGDLFESLLKRQAGIKDSSGLLPGHGGVLDRIDALTSTLPLAALILLFATS